METAMAARLRGPKSSPDDVAVQALAGLRAGAFEVLADDVSRRVRSGLSAGLTVLYPVAHIDSWPVRRALCEANYGHLWGGTGSESTNLQTGERYA